MKNIDIMAVTSRAFVLTIALQLGWASIAAAADADAVGSSEVTLEEVTVTAQKRTENLEDVPIAITVFSGNDLQDMRIDSARELQNVVPGVIVSQGGATTQTYLRGIGNNVTQINADPSVATYIDGIYISSSAVTAVPLSDIQAVEVLKGPQGTLYGRNATGGAVNITTRTPTKDFDARVSIGVGNYSRKEANASVSGGLSDKFFAGVYANYQDREPFSTLRNGSVPVPSLRDKESQWTVRGKLVFDPGAIFRLTGAADITKYGSFQDMAWRQLQQNAQAYAAGAPRLTGEFDTATNGPVDNNWTSKGASLRGDVDFGPVQLVEISAYRQADSYWLADADASTAAISLASTVTGSRQWSHELQLLSSPGGRLQWMVGAYYYSNNGGQFPFHVYPPPVDVVINAGVDTTSYSGFGQATWSATDKLRLTLGARYTDESKQYTGGTATTSSATGAVLSLVSVSPKKASWTKFSPKVGVDYRVGGTLLYVSYSEGFKSGVFNLNGTSTTAIGPVNPENLKAYELGTKSEFLDKRVRLNTALFHYDYSDLQVQTLTSVIPGGVQTATLQNAATAHANGIDFDINWAVAQDLELHLLGEYIDSKYDSFPAFQGYIASTLAAGGNTQRAIDVSGFRTARSPQFTGSLGGSYTNHLGDDLRLKWTTNLYHSSAFAFNADHTVNQDAYTTLQLAVALTTAEENWTVTAWSNNLTDQYYYAYKQINAQGTYGIPAPPRTFGVSAAWRFH